MSKQLERDLLVGLDIGTSKVSCIVAELDRQASSGGFDYQLNVLGYGTHPSTGLNRGEVVNIEATVRSIQGAVDAAEAMAGCKVNRVVTGISGAHIKSLNSHGIVAVGDSEVSQADVDRVIDAARAVAISADQQLLHVLPQDFIIDRQSGVSDPVGMSGVRLEANVHLITSAVSSAQNIVKCVKRCGLNVDDMVLEQLAASYAVLSEDEKNLGVCLVNIGAGTTDIAIFSGGAIRHTAVIPIAGAHVAKDIAVALRVSTQTAEQIKLDHGCAVSALAQGSRRIQLAELGHEGRPREFSHTELTRAIEPRYEELLNLVYLEIRRSGLEDHLPAGIVFTGGSVKIAHFLELAERIFNDFGKRVPVRIGVPRGFAGPDVMKNNPAYATSIGLLHYAKYQQDQGFNKPRRFDFGSGAGLVSKMKAWFKGNF